jgi:hypothetical protein
MVEWRYSSTLLNLSTRCFIPGERASCTLRIGGCEDLSADVDATEKGEPHSAAVQAVPYSLHPSHPGFLTFLTFLTFLVSL